MTNKPFPVVSKPSVAGFSSVLVRRATRADAAALARFNVALARETEGRALDPATVRRGVAAVFRDRRRGFYLVATLRARAAARDNAAKPETRRPRSRGRPVGGLLVTFEWSDWRAAPFLWIQSVYVERSARARGVFRALYGAVVREARRRGACGLRLYVEKSNARAKAVYRRLGMGPTHYELYESVTRVTLSNTSDGRAERPK